MIAQTQTFAKPRTNSIEKDGMQNDQLRHVTPPGTHGFHPPVCDYIFLAGLADPQNRCLQGIFEWRPNSIANDNGGTVIKPTVVPNASPGRWSRVFDGPISVKWFGVKNPKSRPPIS